MREKMNYRQRLDNLNEIENKTVLDSIDRPIRPLILELNRIGLPTKFCCCGFPYDGEEEPKTHSIITFVVLKDIGPLNAVPFFSLARAAVNTGWILTPYNSNFEWHLRYEHTSYDKFYRRNGNLPGIHDYEEQLIKIHQLTKIIEQWPSASGREKEFIIVDGNSNYEALKGEWQVKPKPNYRHVRSLSE